MGLDAIMVLIVLFIVAVCAVVGQIIMSEVNTDVQDDTTINNQSKVLLQQQADDYPTLMDNMFIFVLILFWILVIIASFFIDSHPIFFILAIIVLAAVLFISAVVSNTYVELSEEAEFSTAAAHFTKTLWVFNHLVETILVIAASILIALYGKSRIS